MKKITLLASLLCITEAASAMTTSHVVSGTDCPKSALFKFKEHKFSALCFNTKGCRVEYANVYDVNDADDVISPPPPENLLNLISGVRLGIRNFPGPAKITWRSLDGVRHEESIDIKEIFARECIIHDIPREQIANGVEPRTPSIVLIINDREVSVYMKTMIFLREPRRPENSHSDFVMATTLAYRKTF